MIQAREDRKDRIVTMKDDTIMTMLIKIENNLCGTTSNAFVIAVIQYSWNDPSGPERYELDFRSEHEIKKHLTK